jgi:hypothetical protein
VPPGSARSSAIEAASRPSDARSPSSSAESRRRTARALSPGLMRPR